MALPDMSDQFKSTGSGLNSGNIRSGPHSFKTYDTDEEGAQDHVRLLSTYPTRHNADTIGSIVDVWAPPSDNNKNNAAYKAHIAKVMGVGINDHLDLSDPEVAGKFAYAQAQFEHGANKVTHDENWYIGQANNYFSNSEVPQHATSAKKGALPDMSDQFGTSTTTELPDMSDQFSTEEPPKAPTINAQPPEESTGIWHKAGEGFHELGKSTLLALLGTRDQANMEHPLGYLSPYKTLNDVTPEEVHNAKVIQGVGKKGLEIGAFAAADAATGGLLTPAIGEVLPEVAAPLVSRVVSSAAGSVAGQEAESVAEGKGLVVPDPKTTAIDVAAGEGLNLVSKGVKAGSSAVRGRVKDIARNFEDWKTRFNDADASAQAARDKYQEGANLGAYTGNSGDVIEQHYADLANQRAAERDVIAEQQPPNPQDVIDRSKGKVFLDNSDIPAEAGGMSKTKRVASKVASLTETMAPFVKTAQKVEKIVQDVKNKPSETSPAKLKDSLSVVADLLHTGMSAIGHSIVGIPGAVAGYGAAVGKQALERGHVRDVRRALEGKEFATDAARNKAAKVIKNTPANAPRVITTNTGIKLNPNLKRPAVADPTREARDDESYYNKQGEAVIVISKGGKK